MFADATDEDSPIFGRQEFLEVAAGAHRELLFKILVFVVVFFFLCFFFFFFKFLNVVPWRKADRLERRKWCKALFDHCTLDLSSALQVSASNLMVSGAAIL